MPTPAKTKKAAPKSTAKAKAETKPAASKPDAKAAVPDNPATRPLKKGDHLFLVDGSGYIFRAYHALPPMTRSDGVPVNAVYGFSNMLMKLMDDLLDKNETELIAVIFDAGRVTFRNEIYPAYKANRDETPEDLIPQFDLIRDATRAFNDLASQPEINAGNIAW